MRKLKRFAIVLGLYFAVLFGLAGVLIVFCHPVAPKAMSSVTDAFG